jgi:hypothetical protein
MPALPVTYLFSRACPSHDEGLELLREAAARAGVEIALEVVEVTSDREAEERRFPGSPTYLADGRDLFAPEAPPHAFVHDACRAFARPGGRVGPLPDAQDLARALQAAADRREAA